MARAEVSLMDRFDLSQDRVLLSGTQALVRLMLAQKARDRLAGLNTAGYVTGYRGSPLGGLDLQMARAGDLLAAADIRFQPALNEDLAATACWGTQMAGLRGEGRFDGVFALWYGKGPGVDRSGDALRHANLAGTDPRGGVVMVAGDDHTGESSTTLHQSDFALVDAWIPVISPAGVQEILDLGHYAFALSRFAGVWAGLKAVKDTVEATAVVEGDPQRTRFVAPDLALPAGGLSIRLHDSPAAQEARLVDLKVPAAESFARANRIDRRVLGRPGATIGLVAAGKNWLDLVQALAFLGIDAAEAGRLGITTWKVAQTWPLDRASLRDWAEGLDLIVVVEEKRKLIEPQVREALFDGRAGRRVWGWRRGEGGAELFPVRGALDPVTVARHLAAILAGEGRATERLAAARAELEAAARAGDEPERAARLPYFCAGCPHNTSTRVPEGSRAYAGIGCHYMVQWMDRDTLGYTHMGGEGANWIGEAPFSTRPHVFQNIGDGTYNHSGLMAIRAAVAAGVTMTYKILYNDAVAMTGGQGNDGGLTPARVAAEVMAAGVRHLAVVYDASEEPDRAGFPAGIEWHERAALDAVQRRFRELPGVSVILYVQTCAAEKRRRRRRGAFPAAAERLWINPEVCEGCGDCGVQSNCVALLPVETPLGRKRAIDQSACNLDFSCLKGFCPAFVGVAGGRPRRPEARALVLPDLPEPRLPAIAGTWNLVVAGIGGTGAVTVGAILAQAAHLDGLGAGMIEMAGLAQKGGAVQIHCRIARDPAGIAAIRIAAGEADAVIGGDLVVAAAPATLALIRPGRSAGVVNTHETMTGAFTRDPGFRLPAAELGAALARRLGAGLLALDATRLAEAVLGDRIFANMVLLGAAWQKGLVPLSAAALDRAIALNGAEVEGNRQAFALGRWAAADPDGAARRAADGQAPPPATPAAEIAALEAHLVAYQSERLARRFRALVDAVPDAELRLAVARGYHRLLAVKDEYEVARLHRQSAAQVKAAFAGDLRLTYHLAPPLLARKGPDGRPRKRRFGPWIARLFGPLAALKVLRGTPFDPFGRTEERRMERRLAAEFEADMAEALPLLSPATRAAIRERAELPLAIRGFGPVKAAAAAAAAGRRDALMAEIRAGRSRLRQAAE